MKLYIQHLLTSLLLIQTMGSVPRSTIGILRKKALCKWKTIMIYRQQRSIAPIIKSDAADVPIHPFVRKYRGMPVTAAPLKQIICLFVKFSATFVLIPDKSFGTCTDIAMSFLP